MKRPSKTISIGEAVQTIYDLMQADPDRDLSSGREVARAHLLRALSQRDLTLFAETAAPPKDGGVYRWEATKMSVSEFRQGLRMIRLSRKAKVHVKELFAADEKYFDAKEFQAWLRTGFGASSVSEPHANASVPAKRGPKPTYDLVGFKAEVLERLRYTGAFNPAIDPNWRQSDLERSMAEWCRKKWQKEPSEGWIRRHVSDTHADFLKE